MAQTNEIKNIKAQDLTENTWYTVKKSGFKKATCKKGDFMSAWFMIENESGDVAFLNAPSERESQRYIGIVTACRMAEQGKNGLNVKKIKVVKNGDFINFQYLIEPWAIADNSAPF